MNIRAKTAAQYLSLGALLLNSCYMPTDRAILNGHKTISARSDAILAAKKTDINLEVISQEALPIYQGDLFEKSTLGEYNILKYHSRNIEPEMLKKTLEEQLKGVVDSISIVPETNQLLVRVKNEDRQSTNSLGRIEYSRLEEEIKNVIETIDILPPQIMIELRMVRDFADKTIDWASFLGVSSKEIKGDGLFPNVILNIPGAGLRVPERGAEKGLGVQYGLIGQIGKNIIDARLDSLQSQGFVKDIARPTLTVSNGKHATINLRQELPYQDQIFQGGALFAQTKYKSIGNFLEVTPYARDGGNIYLEVKAGVGSFNPTGVLQVPGITQRDINIGGVYIAQGETLVLGGFRIDHQLAIERKEPWLSRIPGVNKIYPWAQDTESSINEILFVATPYYVDVNKPKYQKYEKNFKNN